MRISDWSSDVCSSDLIRTIANGSPYIATLPAHHAGMRAIDEEVLEISSAHVAAAIREALRELESRIGRVVLACVARMGRSEEHTSELQSLMRISYAVLCLKKKKNDERRSTTTE